MKFNIDWLKKFISIKDTPKELLAQITSAGFEVESVVDQVVVIKVPPNRADCLGMVGMARDVAAITKESFIEPAVKAVPAAIKDIKAVKVLDSVACPRYVGRIIRGIDNTCQTPQWIKDCLLTADINLISPVVDITNYVLLEWGQPLHAFDLSKLEGDIVVRKASNNEALVLLDDTTVQLSADTVVIADQKQALAIAGVKGGKSSGVELDTKDIFLECAYFDPIAVRLASRHYGVKTDAAYRFERCIDPTMQVKIMEHVTQLILDVVGGDAGPLVECSDSKHLPKTTVLSLRITRIKQVIGIDIDAKTTTQILERLGFQVETHNGAEELMITVPPYRPDVTREVDLVEEVARIYGLDNIPALPSHSTLNFKALPEAIITEQAVIGCMVNRGFHEAITYSFIDFDYACAFADDLSADLKLSNPISTEMGFMRQSLVPGLLKALQYNQNRQQTRVRLFEIGLRFNAVGKDVQQTKAIAGVCYGNYLPEAWSNPKRLVDLYDVKGDVLALLALAHNLHKIKFVPAVGLSYLHPGQSLQVYLEDKLLGNIGALHPKLQQSLGLPEPVMLFELDYMLLTRGAIPAFKTFSKYPAIRRDIAIVVDKKVAAASIEHAIHKVAGSLLVDLVLFDVYQGKGIPEDQKSMALGLTLQDPLRTLTDPEVNEIFTNVLTMLQNEFKAVLR